MAEQAEQDRLNEAIAWRIRLRDGRDADWAAFVRWLEADPEHARSYDRVARADAAIELAMVPTAATATALAGASPAAHRRRWATALVATAAVLLLALLTLPWPGAAPSRHEIATAPGERRTVALDDDGSVELNGATRIILDRDDGRRAVLVTGEATFTVRHDPRRPFLLVAGAHRLRDAGTTFNVLLDGDRFAVELVEGALVYNPEGEAATLAAGQTLTVRRGGPAWVGRADPRRMAGWRRGQLSYRGTELNLVARDLTRNLGVEVAVAPGMAARPFTGSIRIAGDEATVAALAATLGTEARRDGGGWRIGPDAPR